jgi:hypothetical protein
MATTAPSGNTSLPGGVTQPPGTSIPFNGTTASGVQLGDPSAGVVSADNGFGDIETVGATPVFWPVPLRDYNRVSISSWAISFPYVLVLKSSQENRSFY